MRCHRHSRALPLYLYGELTDDERRRFENHLETCAQCRQELETFQGILDSAQKQAVPTPSERVFNEIRSAAHNAITDAARRVPVPMWDHRWDGLRPRLVAAAACTLLIAALALLTSVIRREPTQLAPEPRVIIAEPPTPSPVLEDALTQPLPTSDQADTLMAEMYSPTPLEDMLAELEANTFYLHEQMALETAPAFDRQVRSLEHDVVRLASELE